MKNYDPNIHFSKQTVEITYMQWDYTATARVTINGNGKGNAILGHAIGQHADELFERLGDGIMLELKRPAADGSGDEDTLETSPDSDGGNDVEAWLEDMCVGLKIVDVVKMTDIREKFYDLEVADVQV